MKISLWFLKRFKRYRDNKQTHTTENNAPRYVGGNNKAELILVTLVHCKRIHQVAAQLQAKLLVSA